MHVKLAAVILVFLFGSVAGSLSAQSGEGSASPALAEERDFQFAEGLVKDRNYRLAYERFSDFLRRYPGSERTPQAELGAADCLFHERSYADALIRYNAFLENHRYDPLAPAAAFKAAEIHFRREEFEKAKKKYLSILDLYPSSPLAAEAAFWAGESALMADDYNAALKYYTLCYETYPQGGLRDYALFSMGYAEEQKGNYAEALAQYRRLLAEYPSSPTVPDANTHIAAAHFREKQYTQTLDWLNGLSDSPNVENASARLFYRAESEYQLGRYGRAEELYSSYLSAYPNSPRAREVQYSRAWSLFQQAKYAEALSIFDMLGNGSDAVAEASRLRKGVVLRLTKQPQKAQEVLSELVARSPKGPFTDNALFELGMIDFERKDYERASGSFDRVIREFPSGDMLPDAYTMSAECDLALGRNEKALKEFTTVLSLQDAQEETRANAQFRKGFTEFQLGRFVESAQSFRAFRESFPRDSRAVDAALWEAEAQFQQGDYARAAESYAALLEKSSDENIRQDALYGLGWCRFKLKDLGEAERIFIQLTREYRGGKHDVDANLRLGEIQYALRKYTAAAETFRYTARMYPRNPLAPYALLQLAIINHRVNNTPNAINTLKSLIANYPKSDYCDDAQYNIGWMYFQKRDYAVAISSFDQLAQSYPQSPLLPNALYSRADALYNLEKYGEAETGYRALIAAYPNSPLLPDALDGVAQCLRMEGKSEEAGRVTEAYLREHPATTLADLIAFRSAEELYGKRKFDAAAAGYRTLIRDYPQSEYRPTAFLQLARAEAAGNRIDSARAAIAAMRTAYPEHPLSVDASFLAADLAVDDQNYPAALNLLGGLLRLPAASSRADEIRYRRARVHELVHQTDSARTEYREAAAAHPSGDVALRSRIRLALLDAREGAADSASASLAAIARTRGDEIGAEAQYQAGQVLLDAKKLPEAEKELLRVEEAYPEATEYCAKSLLSLGVCYQLQGATAKARQTYRKIIDAYSGTAAADEAAYRLNRLE